MPKKGEGTYGCVHAPSLRCKNKRVTYKGRISKVMDANEAIKEMMEYRTIKAVDPKQEFYLGEPTECDPVDNKATRAEIDQCSSFSGKDIANYKLLIMKDGGVDLSHYISSATKTRDSINRFWKEIRRVILGVSVLVRNGAIHHDLKPQNIVYFEEKDRSNFIDFGLMQSKRTIQTDCSNSKYGFAILHGTFPFEMRFLNKSDYMAIAKNPDGLLTKLVQEISSNPQDAFFTVISHGSHNFTRAEVKAQFIDEYRKMIREDIKSAGYDAFLEKSIDTIDVYGLGYSLLFVLGSFRPYMDSAMADDLDNLFIDTVRPSVRHRITADQLLQRYDAILAKYLGAGNRCEMIGKELNPRTKRCTKKCRPNQVRNDKFVCVTP